MPATDVHGSLALRVGRLSFRGDDRVVVFDHPVGEFRSVVAHGKGLAVVRGDCTYRIVPGSGSPPGGVLANSADPISSDVISWMLSWPGTRGKRSAREARDAWIELLQPLVGTDPV
jgi:hypothetical protein